MTNSLFSLILPTTTRPVLERLLQSKTSRKNTSRQKEHIFQRFHRCRLSEVILSSLKVVGALRNWGSFLTFSQRCIRSCTDWMFFTCLDSKIFRGAVDSVQCTSSIGLPKESPLKIDHLFPPSNMHHPGSCDSICTAPRQIRLVIALPTTRVRITVSLRLLVS